MTNAQIFTNAHAIAKATRNMFVSYRGAFSSALITIYAELRAAKAQAEANSHRVIKEVYVHWSEGSVFNVALGTNQNFDIEKTISIDEYERLANIQASESNESECYDKTKVDVILANGKWQTHYIST